MPSRTKPILLGTLAMAAALAVTVTARAQTALGPEVVKGPLLHQDLKAPRNADGVRTRQPIYGAQPGEHQNPSAFENRGKILPQPPGDNKRRSTEPVHGRGGFAADRDTEYRGDLDTGTDGTLHYVTVFNPTVIPFKRMSSLDAVRDDFTMHTGSTATTDISVGGAQSPNRDLFWGNLVVELAPGRDVPIPSVAPDMRVLSYEIKPQVKLTFSKDAADNYYVRSDEAGVNGTYRLVFLADADARHFAAKVPDGYKVRDVARMAKGMIHHMPANVRHYAQKALREVLHVDRNMPLRTALDSLVYYFRDFRAKANPSPTVNIYWDLLTNKAGVCRHRAFTFMITANALGIPARYVSNEAHAWVEVWVPRVKWIRIDLGGAALRMDVTNAEDKSIYKPRAEDSFAQPPSYKDNYTQLEGDIRGLSDDQRAEAREPAGDDNGSGSGAGAGSDDDDDSGGGGDRIGPGKRLPTLPDSAFDNRVRTSLVVTGTDGIAFRGEDLRVRGVLKAGDDGVAAGQRIDIYLAPSGQNGENAVLIGHAISERDGSFSAAVELPTDLELRDYEVFASTPGDAKFSPALSE